MTGVQTCALPIYILEDIERRIIIEKLERCNGNQTEAAEQFLIPLSTLNQKIKRLTIEIRKKGRESGQGTRSGVRGSAQNLNPCHPE